MDDVIALLVVAAFFGPAAVFVRLCDRIVGRGAPNRERPEEAAE